MAITAHEQEMISSGEWRRRGIDYNRDQEYKKMFSWLPTGEKGRLKGGQVMQDANGRRYVLEETGNGITMKKLPGPKYPVTIERCTNTSCGWIHAFDIEGKRESTTGQRDGQEVQLCPKCKGFVAETVMEKPPKN
jgi:hypothetical protein